MSEQVHVQASHAEPLGLQQLSSHSDAISLLVFTPRYYGNSFPSTGLQAGELSVQQRLLHPSGVISVAKISLLVLICHTMDVRPAGSKSPPLPPVPWLLYILRGFLFS